MSVIDTPEGRRIRWRWRTTMAIPLAFVVLSLDGVGYQYGQSVAQHGEGVHPVLWLFGAFLLVAHYYLLAQLLNRTDVTVTQAGVRVSTGPVPFPRNRGLFVPAENIQHIAAQARDDGEDATFTWYEVTYSGPQGQRGRLINWIDEYDQASFFAHHLRRALRLRREP